MTSGRQTEDTQAWGDDIERLDLGGSSCLVYRDRRHHVADLWLDALRWADRPHLVAGSRRLAFDQTRAATMRVTTLLVDAGAQAGDRVVILAANSPEWLVSFWACVEVGVIPVLANAWWSEPEVQTALELTTPVLAIVQNAFADALPSDLPRLETSAIRKAVDSGEMMSATPRPASSEHDAALILFTSGTTGPAKAVVLSHRSVIANQHNLLRRSKRLPSRLPPGHPGTTALVTLPLFHMGGVQTLLANLLTGGTMVFLEGRPDPGEILRVIERERVRVWGTVPTLLSRVLSHPDIRTRDVSSLVSVTSGGAPLAPALVDQARRLLPAASERVGSLYGLTESGGGLAAINGEDLHARPQCVGEPFPVVELKIANPDATEMGEVLARSPTNMTGFWGSTETPIDPDGWLRTGDLGRLEDKRLYIVGRSKDVIIRGGENISAQHVENRLLEHPSVAAVAVVGQPDTDLGEKVAAAVVLHAGASVSDEELRRFTAAGVASFAVPALWQFRTELPMTTTGKIRKAAVAESWCGREPE